MQSSSCQKAQCTHMCGRCASLCRRAQASEFQVADQAPVDVPPPKTFLLGVGCQKGGTTWLHDHLSGHPNADMGFRKEYHVFDAIHLESCRFFIAEEMRCGGRVLDWFSRPSTEVGASTPLDFYADLETYYDYFEFIAGRDAGVRLVGDMTPSYAGLPTDVFASIRESLEKRKFSVRVLFVMRDPVDRIWSAARMRRRHQGWSARSEGDVVRELFRTPGFVTRTRYDLTIQNLEAAFDADQLRLEFYETLFSHDGIRGVTDFLNLPSVEPSLDNRCNASPKTEELDQSLAREVAEFYRPVYEFCAAKFGSDTLGRLWASYRLLDARPWRQAA